MRLGTLYSKRHVGRVIDPRGRLADWRLGLMCGPNNYEQTGASGNAKVGTLPKKMIGRVCGKIQPILGIPNLKPSILLFNVEPQ